MELIKEKIKAINDEDLNDFINGLEEADLQGENLEYTLSEIDGYLETAENTSITNLQNFVSPEEVELVENLAEATYNAE